MRLRAVQTLLAVLILIAVVVGGSPTANGGDFYWRPLVSVQELLTAIDLESFIVSQEPGLGVGLVVSEEERLVPPRELIQCRYDDLRMGVHAARQRIAFASDRDGDFEIFVMNIDGSGLQQVTHNKVDDVRPDWAPDGRKVVFSRQEELVVADVDKGTVCPLRFNGARVAGTHPAWSPDGKWIAYAAGDCYGMAVTASRLSGGKHAWFADGAETWVALDPTWTPDSRSVGYMDRDDEAFVVERLDRARGNSPPELFPWRRSQQAAFSADGESLVMSVGRGGEFDDDLPHHDYDLFVFADGAKRRIEASDPSTTLAGSWAPDSTRIVMYSNRAGSFDIFTIGLHGEDVRRLTTHPSNDITPDWST